MTAVAVVLTYGRKSICELLAMIARQTLPLRVLVWVDDVPALQFVNLPPLVDVVYGPRYPRRDSVGLIRAACIEEARRRYALTADDAILTLDDDDFYSPHHFALTCHALEGTSWTGAMVIGLDLGDGAPPTLCRGESGCGQHGTWAMRLSVYDDAGGYRDEREADVCLQWRAGFRNCAPHHYLTHVRAHHGFNLSGSAHFDRVHMRARDERTILAGPDWTERCERLARWCADHQAEQPDDATAAARP